MKKEKLVMYEMPVIAEFISIGWMQSIVGHYVAWKVNRKMKRWKKRIERKEFLKNYYASKKAQPKERRA